MAWPWWIHEAVDAVFDVFQKYYVLIFGEAVMRGVIMNTMPPWPSEFRVPWIPEENWRYIWSRVIALELDADRAMPPTD